MDQLPLNKILHISPIVPGFFVALTDQKLQIIDQKSVVIYQSQSQSTTQQLTRLSLPQPVQSVAAQGRQFLMIANQIFEIIGLDLKLVMIVPKMQQQANSQGKLFAVNHKAYASNGDQIFDISNAIDQEAPAPVESMQTSPGDQYFTWTDVTIKWHSDQYYNYLAFLEDNFAEKKRIELNQLDKVFVFCQGGVLIMYNPTSLKIVAVNMLSQKMMDIPLQKDVEYDKLLPAQIKENLQLSQYSLAPRKILKDIRLQNSPMFDFNQHDMHETDFWQEHWSSIPQRTLIYQQVMQEVIMCKKSLNYLQYFQNQFQQQIQRAQLVINDELTADMMKRRTDPFKNQVADLENINQKLSQFEQEISSIKNLNKQPSSQDQVQSQLKQLTDSYKEQTAQFDQKLSLLNEQIGKMQQENSKAVKQRDQKLEDEMLNNIQQRLFGALSFSSVKKE